MPLQKSCRCVPFISNEEFIASITCKAHLHMGTRRFAHPVCWKNGAISKRKTQCLDQMNQISGRLRLNVQRCMNGAQMTCDLIGKWRFVVARIRHSDSERAKILCVLLRKVCDER